MAHAGESFRDAVNRLLRRRCPSFPADPCST